MATSEELKKELATLYTEGVAVLQELVKDKENGSICLEYQQWYTMAIKVVQTLAPDRLGEFRGYYEPDPRRKHLGYGTYVIQDYFKGVVPDSFNCPEFNSVRQVTRGLINQISILNSLVGRIDSVLAHIETTLLVELQDAELATAHDLLTVSPRAGGAVAGVVLEGHLQKVARNRGVSISKKHPTIGDLNDPLKQAGIYDTTTWRKISYLGDIRNLCTHKKDADPTKEQVVELIEGVNWAIKNVQ